MAECADMNTQKLGIPSTVNSFNDHLIPAQLIAPSRIERPTVLDDDTAVLEKWHRKFALNLRWPEAVHVHA